MCQNCNSPINTHKDGANSFCGHECGLHFKCKQLLESDDAEKSELAARVLVRYAFALTQKEFIDAFALKIRTKVEGTSKEAKTLRRNLKICRFLVPYLYGFMTYRVPESEEHEYQMLKRFRIEIANCADHMTTEEQASLHAIAQGVGCFNY